jgi:hypothetical protein
MDFDKVKGYATAIGGGLLLAAGFLAMAYGACALGLDMLSAVVDTIKH